MTLLDRIRPIAWSVNERMTWDCTCIGTGAGQFNDCSSPFHVELYAFNVVRRCVLQHLYF